MHKTIIFIINSPGGYINKYKNSFFSKLKKYRLVLIINKSMVNFLDVNKLPYFSKIYEVEESKPGYYHKTLNETHIEAVIKQELQYGCMPSEILLVSHNESCVLLLARLKEKFNLFGMSLAVANNFRNKILMKNQLLHSNVRVPKYMSLKNSVHNDPLSIYKIIKEKINDIFILKPIDGAGSFGIKKVSNYHEFYNFYLKRRELFENYEAEEYIEGELYHCDSIVQKSEIKLTFCAKYNYPLLDYIKGKNVGSIVLENKLDLTDKLTNFNNEILRKLRASDGIFHTEIFINKKTNEPVFLESAARAPGGYIVQMYEKAYELNLLNLDLEMKLGSYKSNKTVNCRTYCFWIYFPPVQGTVQNIKKLNLKSNYKVNWRINVGDKLNKPVSLKDRAGEILVWNKNYKELLQDLEYLNNNYFIEVS